MATEIRKEAGKYGLWDSYGQKWRLQPEFEVIETLADDFLRVQV